MNDDLSYFLLAGLLFLSSLLFATWKRMQILKKIPIGTLKGPSPKSAVAKIVMNVVLLTGLICTIASTIMQNRDIERKSRLNELYKGTVSSFVRSNSQVESGLRIQGRLYNGLDVPIFINWTNHVKVDPKWDSDKRLLLNGFSNCSNLIGLAPRQEFYLDFVLPNNVSTNLKYGILYALRQGDSYVVRTNYLCNVRRGINNSL